MPHHFKWINRATLLFNLASAELVCGWVGRGVGGCVWEGCDQRCTGLSVFVVDTQTDGQTNGCIVRGMEGQKDQMIGRGRDWRRQSASNVDKLAMTDRHRQKKRQMVANLSPYVCFKGNVLIQTWTCLYVEIYACPFSHFFEAVNCIWWLSCLSVYWTHPTLSYSQHFVIG